MSNGDWSEGVQALRSSSSVDLQFIDESYKVKVERSVMQRLSTVSRINRRASNLPRSPLVSHLSIDLLETTPARYCTGWKPIAIKLPPSGDTEPRTYRVTKPIPFSTGQLDYARIGFRLTEVPAPNEITCISLRYHSKYTTSHRDYWMPKPLGSLLSKTVWIHCARLRMESKPGELLQSGLAKAAYSGGQDPSPQVVVEWKFRG